MTGKDEEMTPRKYVGLDILYLVRCYSKSMSSLLNIIWYMKLKLKLYLTLLCTRTLCTFVHKSSDVKGSARVRKVNARWIVLLLLLLSHMPYGRNIHHSRILYAESQEHQPNTLSTPVNPPLTSLAQNHTRRRPSTRPASASSCARPQSA